MSSHSENALAAFLSKRAAAEDDQQQRMNLLTLVRQWSRPAPGVKSADVWEAMVAASHTYSDVAEYQAQWSR